MIVRNYVRTLWWRLAAGVLASLLTCPPAEAQTFFQSLFGFGSAKPAASSGAVTKPQSQRRAGLQPRSFTHWKAERTQSTREDSDGYQRNPAFGGSYRTVCVRTCDGYYWPVSQAVTREGFSADERRCDRDCAGEAKLYYAPKWTENPREFVDLQGNNYTKLKTAFLYRRTLISGCGCRPAPWSVAETFRHHQYAAADLAKKLEAEAQRQRAVAEALRKDKIAQIIAATEAAIALDQSEDVIASVDDPTPDSETPALAAAAPSTVTGYVHLHVLPAAVVDLAEAGQLDTPALDPDTLIAAVAALAVDLPGAVIDVPAAHAEDQARTASDVPDAHPVRRNRKSPVRTARAKPQKDVKTSWAFGGGQSQYTWPGDAPRRAR